MGLHTGRKKDNGFETAESRGPEKSKERKKRRNRGGGNTKALRDLLGARKKTPCHRAGVPGEYRPVIYPRKKKLYRESEGAPTKTLTPEKRGREGRRQCGKKHRKRRTVVRRRGTAAGRNSPSVEGEGKAGGMQMSPPHGTYGFSGRRPDAKPSGRRNP